MKRTMAAVSIIALLAATGCGENGRPSDRVLTGAGVGAVVGALGGLLVGGDDRRNALVGAGIGLLVGGAIGAYLDEQERRLKTDLDGTGAEVTRFEDRLLISLPDSLTFNVDSDQLRPNAGSVMRSLAASLNDYPSSYVDVIGHTDNTGSATYNQELSERRALRVEDELIRRAVNPARIASAGFGETQAIGDNNTPEGRARNRRVEVYIIPAS